MSLELTTFDEPKWRYLFDTLYDDPQSLHEAVGELRRIAEFHDVAFSPSFEEVIEEVRSNPKNQNDCGHAPSFDQTAYYVLRGAFRDYGILEKMPLEFRKLFDQETIA